MDAWLDLAGVGDRMDTVFALAKGLLLIGVVGVGVYLVRTVGGFLAPVVRFMFGVRPGEPPGELVGGLLLGFRLFAWAAVLGTVLVWITQMEGVTWTR
jgi:hypothetical protein